jgi:mannosyltransferase OCH1-like enzyme
MGSGYILDETATMTAPLSSDTSRSPDSTDEQFTGSAAYRLPAVKSKQQLQSSLFPAKLWQKSGTYRIDDSRRNDIKSWQIQTPSLRHEILTDGSGDQYMREKYADYPELLNLYLSLQVPILKADLLRQLILYNDGGIWSDLDVTCRAPINTWIPEQYKNKTNVVVGLEFDGSQFASWTVMAKPRTSHIANVLRYIVSQLDKSAVEYNTTIHGLTMKTIRDVVDVTGPQAMTRGIIQSLEREMGLPVGRANISNLHEPVLLQDVLVLPNAAFAAMQAGWPTDRGPYLVEHHYAGSWKNDKGGEDKGG